MGLRGHVDAAVRAVTALVIVLVIVALLAMLQGVLEEREPGEKKKTS